MILRSLHLEHYKQYRLLDLEFREGLVGIVGKNGAGKSTLFEAILYCLFGRDESNKSLVRSSFADPKANVVLILEFSIGEVVYAVRREFRGKTLTTHAEFFKNDKQIAKGMSAVNEEIAKVLHMERDAFKRSVFSGQKELSELSDTSGEARKRMVRKMLGLDTLDEVQKSVNSDRNALDNQVVGQRQSLIGPEEIEQLEKEGKGLQKELKKVESGLKKEEAALEKIQARYRKAKEQFDREEDKMQRHNALEGELGQLRERLAGLISRQEQLTGKKAELQEKRKTLDEKREQFAQYIADKATLTGMEDARQRRLNFDTYTAKIAEHEALIKESGEKLAALGKQLSGKAAVEKSLSEKQSAVAALESDIEARRRELRDTDARIAALGARIRERSEKIASLQAIGKEGSCPTCFQPLLDSYDRVLRDLNGEIAALQSEELEGLQQEKERITQAGLSLKSQQEAARREQEQLLKEQSRLAELSRQHATEAEHLKHLEGRRTRDLLILREIGEVDFDERAYQALKAGVAELEAPYLDFSKEDNYVAREWPATEKDLEATGEAIARLRETMAGQEKAIAGLHYDADAYIAARQTVSDFNENLGAQTAAVRALEKEKFEHAARIARIEEKVRANEQIQAQISDKLQEHELLGKLSALLGQFKTDILERVSPSISKEASDLFSRITRGKYESIRVDENFDFAIADGGVFYPIERFSGGEIDLANFCLRIAITKAIMELSGAGQAVEFLAFDEIFGSQDEERRHEMMLALHFLQEQFRQIYIVSHIESLKDYFPHILEVQYGADGSAVVWR
ncbi:MAG: SMC family ATPase [Lewinellaceae bacterium]|nr:SMC family ATPase [Lewinellaceae bacterium]